MKAVSIQLANGKAALIDEADSALVTPFTWHAFEHKRGVWYAMTHAVGDGPKTVYMHRVILGAPAGVMVDHRNSDGLDNRRENLRLATRAQNMANQRKLRGSSKFKGVSWDSYAARWRADICIDGRNRYLGKFDDEVKAAEAYDNAARMQFKEFARPNFPAPGEIGCLVESA